MKYLIAGLGNIGPEYAETRHNIGFMVLDAFAKAEKLSFSLERHAFLTETSVKGRKLILVKPTTYVNLSGKAVSYWIQQYKIPIENLLVIIDDIALPFGTLRLKTKGGDAGHNGLISIHQCLGTTEYTRLRFGIGNNYPKGRQVDYVLGNFTQEETGQLPLLLDQAVEVVKSFVTAGSGLTMTKFNR